MGTGHPCFGCTEKGIGFTKPIHALATVQTYAPPTAFPAVASAKGEGVSPAAAAVIGGIAGLAVGAGAMALRGMDGGAKSDADSGEQS